MIYRQDARSALECGSVALVLTRILVMRSIDSLTYGEFLPRRGKP